jgi:hypothetical protein
VAYSGSKSVTATVKIDIDRSAIVGLEALIAGKAAQIAAKTVKRKRARV